MRYTNLKDIPIALAVWLVNDDYDYINDPNYISVTSLMRPVKQLVLSQRVKQSSLAQDTPPDLESLIPSALGSTIHTGVENAWGPERLATNMAKLGYTQEQIARIKVNPTDPAVIADKNNVIVWIEQRAFRQVGKWRVGGKFDFVIDGAVQDTKTTTAFTWLYGGKDDQYIEQGSQYRWLNPDKITEDVMAINFVFTDWSAASAKTNPDYPDCRIKQKTFFLKPVEQVERENLLKLQLIEQSMNLPEEMLPPCTEEEVWLSEPVFKYYADPAKTSGRSTKNFSSLLEANAHKAAAGKGVVIPQPRIAKRCSKYCDGFALCKQKDQYQHD